jgi:hypothetical protein
LEYWLDYCGIEIPTAHLWEWPTIVTATTRPSGAQLVDLNVSDVALPVRGTSYFESSCTVRRISGIGKGNASFTQKNDQHGDGRQNTRMLYCLEGFLDLLHEKRDNTHSNPTNESPHIGIRELVFVSSLTGPPLLVPSDTQLWNFREAELQKDERCREALALGPDVTGSCTDRLTRPHDLLYEVMTVLGAFSNRAYEAYDHLIIRSFWSLYPKINAVLIERPEHAVARCRDSMTRMSPIALSGDECEVPSRFRIALKEQLGNVSAHVDSLLTTTDERIFDAAIDKLWETHAIFNSVETLLVAPYTPLRREEFEIEPSLLYAFKYRFVLTLYKAVHRYVVQYKAILSHSSPPKAISTCLQTSTKKPLVCAKNIGDKRSMNLQVSGELSSRVDGDRLQELLRYMRSTARILTDKPYYKRYGDITFVMDRVRTNSGDTQFHINTHYSLPSKLMLATVNYLASTIRPTSAALPGCLEDELHSYKCSSCGVVNHDAMHDSNIDEVCGTSRRVDGKIILHGIPDAISPIKSRDDGYKKLFHKDSKKNDKDLFMNVAGFRYGLS